MADYGFSVYGEDGSLYFSTRYSPFNYLGVVLGHTEDLEGEAAFNLAEGRELVCYPTHPSVYQRIPGDNSTLDINNYVEFVVDGDRVSWKYVDYEDPWHTPDFEFVIIIFTRDI